MQVRLANGDDFVINCFMFLLYSNKRCILHSHFFYNSYCYESNVFQLPEGRMLTYFYIVAEGSFFDVPNAGEIREREEDVEKS